MISLLIDQPSDSDQRIDKFIKKYLPLAPLSGIYKWLRTGKIKVNRKKVDQTYMVEIEDRIDIHLRDEEILEFRKGKDAHISQGTPGSKEQISPQIDILFEDEYFMVVNKPPGINVHPGDHKTKELSLIEIIQDRLGESHHTLTFKPALVHRIDRDTSGTLMIAKDKQTLEALLSLLQSGKIEKVYHAIVLGTPEKPRDTIRAKLLRIDHAEHEAKVQVHEGGQVAITHYRTLDAHICGKYSLLEIILETGRTHQIRVHMAHIGHPILGDKSYGNSGENSFAKREYGVTRQLLHAERLRFIHPITKKEITIIAPYPSDIALLVDHDHANRGNQ